MRRLLILEDGSVYEGEAFGSDKFQIGELIFQTGMCGYRSFLLRTDNNYDISGNRKCRHKQRRF